MPAAPMARSASSSTAMAALRPPAGLPFAGRQIVLAMLRSDRRRPPGSMPLRRAGQPQIAGLDRHAHAREPVRLVGIGRAVGSDEDAPVAASSTACMPAHLHGEKADAPAENHGWST